MKKAIIPTTMLAVALLTGCSASDATHRAAAPSAPATAPAVTPVPTPTGPARSDRGNLIKTVGQIFGYPGKGTDRAATFVINAITLDPPCTNDYTQPSENGHFLKVDITGETTPDFEGHLFVGRGAWKVITDAGTTVNGDPSTAPAFTCLPESERFPDTVGPGEKVAGAIILDVPTDHGVLILRDGASRDGGWEWSY